MKVFGIILAVIIFLAGAGGAGYIGYNEGFVSGETDGYKNGYTAGQDYGYDWGSREGYTAGFDNGEEQGYQTGYDIGTSIGYDSGYSQGEESGFIVGRDVGFETGYEDGYAVGVEQSLGHSYTLRDPTYSEAVSFMKSDPTDKNQYVEGEYGVYVCSHYSRDTGNNAESLGFRCALVEFRYLGSGHTIIAFNTIDRGMVYFEPQSDEIVLPEIGKRYYQCIVPAPGTYYQEPDFDDTILDMLIIW